MTGYAPDASAMNHLQNVLNTYLNKPSGITIVTKEISASSSTTLSIDQVRNNRRTKQDSVYNRGSVRSLCFIYKWKFYR